MQKKKLLVVWIQVVVGQGGINLVCMQPRGEGGGAQMRAQYISLCSNNDVILRARGEGGHKCLKNCVHTK